MPVSSASNRCLTSTKPFTSYSLSCCSLIGPLAMAMSLRGELRLLSFQAAGSGIGAVFPPGDIALTIGKAPQACLLDGRVGHFVKRCIARVGGGFVRIISRRVVAADQRPARILRAVLVRTVQKVAMKEER